MRRFFLTAMIGIAILVLIGACSMASISSAWSSTSTPITTLDAAPVPVFIAHPFAGNVPLEVTFADRSTNTPDSWSWDFGDGSTSTEQNPVHTYNEVGRYTVSFTAANDAGSNSVTYMYYINVRPARSLLPTPSDTPTPTPFPTLTPTPTPTASPTAAPNPTPMVPWKPMPPMQPWG